MGEKLQISIVRSLNRDNLGSGREQNLQNNVFLSVKWFENPGFKFSSNSGKKKIVKNNLKITPRSKISSKYSLRKKERVIVTQQGNHSIEDALFDKKIKLPNHLVDEIAESKKGVLHG